MISGCSTHDVGAAIIEPCPIVRLGIRRVMEAQPGIAVLFEAGTVAESQDTLHELRPDVVLLGVDPFIGSVREQLGEIIPAIPDSAVVILSATDWDVVLAQAWEAGAAGYVLRQTDADRLVDVIRQAAAKLYAFTPEQQGRIQVWRQGLGQRLTSLSPRELQVFRLLRSGRNARAIAAELSVSPNTAAKQIAAVQSKLGVHSQVELMALVMQHHLEYW